MELLYSEETIYSIPDAIDLDSNLSHKQLVICRKSDLENGGREKLSEILNAINWNADSNLEQLELNNTDVVNLSTGLTNRSSKRVVISFGLSPKEVGLQCPYQYYHPFTFENAIVIFSHRVQELLPSKEYKSNLWNAIKSYKA